MTKRTATSDTGLEPHYKVRVVPLSAILHMASRTEPAETRTGWGTGWVADWIADHRYGDTIGFINWDQVVAITWRWSE